MRGRIQRYFKYAAETREFVRTKNEDKYLPDLLRYARRHLALILRAKDVARSFV